jgi:N-acetylmuramoyl-L-alanine amidase
MKQKLMRMGLLAVLSSACLAAAHDAPADVEPPKTVAAMDLSERQLLVAEMQHRLDAELIGKQFFEGFPWPLGATVGLDESDNLVTVDLDERLFAYAGGAESEDLGDYVLDALWPLMQRIGGITGLKLLYGGRQAEPLHEESPVLSEPPASVRLRRSVDPRPLLVISPGHGFYFHGGFKDWRAQRDPVNGILEDDITTVIAGHLEDALERDDVRVENLRPERQPFAHAPSKQPWWRLAVRYQLEQKYPDLKNVWQSKTNGKSPMQQRDEDIRSRPFYANHVKADALLHIHTNASKEPSVSGLRAYFAGRPEDRVLAERILCSTRELVHTVDRFSDYPVAMLPSLVLDKGELNYAKMPSVIVEVGFHTNAHDAAFLRERSFQALAMRGVAKGYRLFRNKRPCEEFAVNPGGEVAGRVGIDVQMPFSFKGNPVYPIRVWSRDEKCTYRGCHNVDKTLSGPSDLEKFKLKYLCKREDLERSPIEVTVGAKDFDGVRAAPAALKVICKAG